MRFKQGQHTTAMITYIKLGLGTLAAMLIIGYSVPASAGIPLSKTSSSQINSRAYKMPVGVFNIKSLYKPMNSTVKVVDFSAWKFRIEKETKTLVNKK